MKIGVSVSLDVTKIDKSRMTQVTKKDGSTATYLNMTTFIDTTSRISMRTTASSHSLRVKEEREAGEERPPILGNVKVFYTDGAAPAAPAPDPVVNSPITEDIPF